MCGIFVSHNISMWLDISISYIKHNKLCQVMFFCKLLQRNEINQSTWRSNKSHIIAHCPPFWCRQCFVSLKYWRLWNRETGRVLIRETKFWCTEQPNWKNSQTANVLAWYREAEDVRNGNESLPRMPFGKHGNQVTRAAIHLFRKKNTRHNCKTALKQNICIWMQQELPVGN